jgi:hypothetical protein
MVGALSRWLPCSSSVSTNLATSARLIESRMLIGSRDPARSRPVAEALASRAGRMIVQSRPLAPAGKPTGTVPQ